MLNERQRGKLRLCLILLITAAVCFAACTVIGTLMARSARQAPVSVPVNESAVETEADLKAFGDMVRSSFPGQTVGSLSELESSLSSYRGALDYIGSRMAEFRALQETQGTTVEALMDGDARFSEYYLPYLGLGQSAIKWEPAVASSAAGDDGDKGATPQTAATPITETAVTTALNNATRIADAAQRALDHLRARNSLVNMDWAALQQAKLGLPVPPDWPLDNAYLFYADTYTWEAQYRWDTLDLDGDPTTVPYPETRPEVQTGAIWWYAALCGGVLLSLAAAWLALGYAEKGRKLAAVLWASLFTLLALPLAVTRLARHVSLLVNAGLEWQTLAGAVGYAAAVLFIILFYGYTYTAHRVKSRKLALAALILGLVTILGLAVRNVMPALHVLGRGDVLSTQAALAFLLLNAGRLLLWALTALALMLGVRRSREERPAAEPSMFPALDAYRVSLRKERA